VDPEGAKLLHCTLAVFDDNAVNASGHLKRCPQCRPVATGTASGPAGRPVMGLDARARRPLPGLLAALLVSLFLIGGVRADASTEALAAAQAGDHAKALRLWLPLAEAGDALAQYNVGVLHEQGLGVPRDDAQAMWWYLKSAAQGYGWAAYNLAGQFRDGRGVPGPEPAEAERHYRQAAAAGVPDAAWVLANTVADPDERQLWTERAAQGGLPEAQLALAEWLLATSPATDRERLSLALGWVEKARARGAAGACVLHARALLEGWGGGPPDPVAAATTLRTGAEAGNAACQRALGLAYGRGEGVVQDFGQAVFWYVRAARQGDTEAQYLVCLSFRLGRGLAPSLTQAWAWCRLAANTDHAAATLALGLIEEDLQAIPGERARAEAALGEIRVLVSQPRP